MDGRAAAQLAGWAMPYVVVRISASKSTNWLRPLSAWGRIQIPNLGQNDYSLRVRDNLFRRIAQPIADGLSGGLRSLSEMCTITMSSLENSCDVLKK